MGAPREMLKRRKNREKQGRQAKRDRQTDRDKETERGGRQIVKEREGCGGGGGVGSINT